MVTSAIEFTLTVYCYMEPDPYKYCIRVEDGRWCSLVSQIHASNGKLGPAGIIIRDLMLAGF